MKSTVYYSAIPPGVSGVGSLATPACRLFGRICLRDACLVCVAIATPIVTDAPVFSTFEFSPLLLVVNAAVAAVLAVVVVVKKGGRRGSSTILGKDHEEVSHCGALLFLPVCSEKALLLCVAYPLDVVAETRNHCLPTFCTECEV